MSKADFTQDDLDSWLEHPATAALVQLIQNNIQARKDIAASGGCLSEHGFEDMGQRYFAQMNTITVYENLLADLQQVEILFPKEEDETNGSEGSEDMR
jgi:hypothetical protein